MSNYNNFLFRCLLTLYICLNYLPSYAQNNSLNNEVYKLRICRMIESLIENKYVIEEKAKIYADEFRTKYTAGNYESIADAKEFAEKITKDLQAITNDKHVSLRKIEPSDIGEETEGALHHSIRLFRLRNKENTGFYKLEWIKDQIGYINVRRFYPISEAKEMMTAAMKFLSNANAIIIDIRENGGGSGDYLSSYFLKYPTQLTGWYYRANNYLEEYWTSNDINLEPLTEVPVFIIMGKNTFSASESFAYDMKVRKRAVLVGEPTKGGAHSVDLFKLDDRFEIYISTSRAVNPVTGENWEGTGVIPDVQVPSEVVSDTTIVLAEKAANEYAASKDVKLKAVFNEMQDYLSKAENYFKENKTEEANGCLEKLFTVGQKNGLINEFFINVLAYNYYSNKTEDILFALLKKSTECFPGSSSAFEMLASSYYDFEKYDLATEYYKKVLELNPANTNAQKRLKELENKIRKTSVNNKHD